MPTSPALLARLAELTPDPLATLTPDGEVLAANPAWALAFGGETWLSDVHPDDRPAVESGLRKAVLGQATTVELRLRGKGERLRHVEFHLVGDPTERAIHAHGRDVTRRQKAGALVRATEARLEALAQTPRDGIVSADHRGRIVFWNKGAARIFGWRADDVRGRPLTILMPERYRAAHRTGMERFAARGEVRVAGRTFEVEGLRRDGGEFPMELSIGHADVGGEHAFTAIVRDMSRHVGTRTELRIAEQRFAEVFEGAAVPIALLLPTGVVTDANRAFCGLTGRTAEELSGSAVGDLLDPGDRPALQAAVDGLLAGRGVRWSGDLRLVAGTGGDLHVSAHVGLVRSSDSIPMHLVVTLEDLTERRRVLAALAAFETRYQALVATLPASAAAALGEGAPQASPATAR